MMLLLLMQYIYHLPFNKTMDYKTATDFEHLLESMYKCQRNVIWKESVASYSLNGLERTMQLTNELKDGTYQPRPTKVVKITHPKPREAISIPFRDRVYQRSLNDNIVYPAMTKSLIYDNGACQKGKGTDFVRGRIKAAMQKYYKKNGLDGWVLQCDIRKYYNTINHGAAELELQKKLDAETAQHVREILRYQYSGDVGYNPGSQMVQIIGISLLNGMDHKEKDQCGGAQYWRYVDDFVRIGKDKDRLMQEKLAIEQELKKYGLELHQHKTKIYKLSDGIETLGFKFRLTDTGKVIMSPDGKRVKENRRKYRRMARLVEQGKMEKETVDKSFECWMAHLKHGNTYDLRKKLKVFYNSLWR